MKTLRKIAIGANIIGAITFGTPLIEEKFGIVNVAHAQRREIDPLQIPIEAQQIVRRIVGETRDPLERATRIFHEFRNGGSSGIRYFYHSDQVRNATEVFQLRGGDCDEIGYLFTGAILYANSLETNPNNRIHGGRRRYAETGQIQPQSHFIIYIDIEERKYFFDLTQSQRQDFEYVSQGLRLIEERSDLSRIRANYYQQNGSVFLRAGNYNRAIENYQRSLRADPQDLNSVGLLGIAQFRSGRINLAVANLERARGQIGEFFEYWTIAQIKMDIIESLRQYRVRNYRGAELSLQRAQERLEENRNRTEIRVEYDEIQREIVQLRGNVAIVRIRPQITRGVSIIERAIERGDTQECTEEVVRVRNLVRDNVPPNFDLSSINIQLTILDARCIAQE